LCSHILLFNKAKINFLYKVLKSIIKELFLSIFLNPQSNWETVEIKYNPLYSYLSKAKGMNVRWALGCKAEKPRFSYTQNWEFLFSQF